MSISSAIFNAASGLTASARAVQVASSNVANALTEGYAARQLNLTSSSLSGVGSGVRVAGVARLVDPVLLGLSRAANAESQGSSTRATFWQKLEARIGQPGEGLSQALSAFDSALISASERPDLDSRLSRVTTTASALANSLGALNDTVQSLRADADAAISRDVDALNSGLTRIDELNSSIVKLRAAGQSTLGLEDERQALLSTLSDIVPMREYPRPDGRVTLFTTGGQLLLDINPQPLEFSPTPGLDASLLVGAGLSGLTIGGQEVDPGANGPIAGGRLAANFTLRDTDAVAAQAELDALTTNLIARFEAAAADPTRGAGDPGLFTDAGAALAASPAVGIAGRIAVNALVVPEDGGALWRLRDGIGAAAPGPVGDASQILNLMAALDQPVASGAGSAARGFAQTLADVSSGLSLQRQYAEDAATRNTAQASELTQQMLAQGVDTDAEMQRLLSVEQAYAANTRVIQTADAMLRRLLEI